MTPSIVPESLPQRKPALCISADPRGWRHACNASCLGPDHAAILWVHLRDPAHWGVDDPGILAEANHDARDLSIEILHIRRAELETPEPGAAYYCRDPQATISAGYIACLARFRYREEARKRRGTW